MSNSERAPITLGSSVEKVVFLVEEVVDLGVN